MQSSNKTAIKASNVAKGMREGVVNRSATIKHRPKTPKK